MVSAEQPAPAPVSASVAPRPREQSAVVFASVALYALSLALPALRQVGLGTPDERGYIVMATGWVGILFGQFGWFANLFWAAALIQLARGRWKAATVTAWLAVLVAADTFVLYRTGFPSDSGRSHSAAILVGFYVWWGSLWLLAVGALVLWRRRVGADLHGEDLPPRRG
jgi:MYXO-CTERM domain-containing protein